MNQKKLILMMSAFAFIIMISAMPVPAQARPIEGTWITMSMNGPYGTFGTWNSGTLKAAEQKEWNIYGEWFHIFGRWWTTASAIPAGADITSIRVKFYFKAYFYNTLFGWYYNEPIKVNCRTTDGVGQWGPTLYYPSNYLTGSYITILIGSIAEGRFLSVDINDGNDAVYDGYHAWWIGAPIVQYYSTA